MACGDTTAEWVPSGGSVWSGKLDPGTANEVAFTLTLAPPVLGVQLAATVMVAQTGAGTWVHDYDLRWTSDLAGVWHFRFEVTANACDGGKVTEAGGGTTDGLGVVHPVTMTRTA